MKRGSDDSFISFILFTLLWKVMYYIHSRANRRLTAFVIFGFYAYLFVRHSHKARLQTVAFFDDYRFIPHRADRVYALMSSIRVMLLRVAPSAVFGWV
ncbi:hypothetical protein [Bacillus subtilis]|uniref:hypothetical protein n=1 Tax=Bacillus subtilis TaxID=1423 RepID=UPI002029E809|nr:hypothetical protein [Bacillus subtilis]